ncbi:MAG: hypothetical protein P8I80_00290 [Bacteroidales bacterium]|jgi:hypothetical protein|nr:hypothetical protein [Bacteroidales bacterium]MDG2082135.1 hypothetical protein [Bacteroidales bacterium]
MKKLYLITILSLLLTISISSCSKRNDVCTCKSIELSGVIEKQGITSYMYGTHVIEDYALRSNIVDLNNYINQDVVIIGYKIDGYPVDGGPDYIEVQEIK